MIKQYIRLPLEGAYNVRDLGGYACEGGVTRFGVYLRGDDLSGLTEGDIALIREYGVETVVDLRSPRELLEHPDPFAEIGEVDYLNLSLMAGDVDDASRAMTMDPENALGEFYYSLVAKEAPLLRQVIEAIAAARGAVLFHCAGGKDRTGVIAMLLLGLAGVARQDIVANYQITRTYLNENPLAATEADAYPQALMDSRPEYLDRALAFIAQAGGFTEYLLSAGVPEGSLDHIRNRFVAPVLVGQMRWK